MSFRGRHDRKKTIKQLKECWSVVISSLLRRNTFYDNKTNPQVVTPKFIEETTSVIDKARSCVGGPYRFPQHSQHATLEMR